MDIEKEVLEEIVTNLRNAWTDMLQFGSHEGECTFEPPCPTCGQVTGACEKHGKAMREREVNMDGAILALQNLLIE